MKILLILFIYLNIITTIIAAPKKKGKIISRGETSEQPLIQQTNEAEEEESQDEEETDNNGSKWMKDRLNKWQKENQIFDWAEVDEETNQFYCKACNYHTKTDKKVGIKGHLNKCKEVAAQGGIQQKKEYTVSWRKEILKKWKKETPYLDHIYVNEELNSFSCNNCHLLNSKTRKKDDLQLHGQKCITPEWKKFYLIRWQIADPAFNNFVVDEQTNEFVCDACKEYRQKENFKVNLQNHLNNCKNIDESENIKYNVSWRKEMLKKWQKKYPELNQIYVDENKNTFACKNCDQYNSKEIQCSNIRTHIKRCGMFNCKKYYLNRWQQSDPIFNTIIVDENTGEFVCTACEEYRTDEIDQEMIYGHIKKHLKLITKYYGEEQEKEFTYKRKDQFLENTKYKNLYYVSKKTNNICCRNCNYCTDMLKKRTLKEHFKACQFTNYSEEQQFDNVVNQEDTEAINETNTNDTYSNNPIFVELFGYSPEPPNPNECYHSIEDYYRHTTYDNGANEDQVLQPGIEQSGQRRSNTLTIQEGRQRRSRPRVTKGKDKQKVVTSSDDNSSKSN